MFDWFVCPTVSMVTTGRASGLENALFHDHNLAFFMGLRVIVNFSNPFL